MPVVGFFPDGGIDISDATATAADIRAGKTAYTADGLTSGTLTGSDFVKQASARVAISSGSQTISLGFVPYLIVLKSQASIGNSSIAWRESDGTYMIYIESTTIYAPAGFSVNGTTFTIQANENRGTYGTYYAVGV